jgi:YcxB-like protein
MGAAVLPSGWRRGAFRAFVSFLVCLVLLGSSIVRKMMVVEQFARMDGKEIWYEFGESGVRCGMPHSETRLNWPVIADAVETDTLFVLKSGALFYTIPKRALTGDDAVTLKALFTQNVTSRR